MGGIGRRFRVLASLALTIALGAFGGRAEAHDAEPAPSRTLGRHTFVFPTFQPSAFVTTHIGIRQGIELYEQRGISLGQFGTYDARIFGLREHADFAVKLAEPVGLVASLGGAIRGGNDVPSFIKVGATYEYAGTLGALVRLYRSERGGTQVSARFDVGIGRAQHVHIETLVDRISVAPLTTVQDLVVNGYGRYVLTTTRSSTVSPQLAFAHAFSPSVGLQGSARIDVERSLADPYDFRRWRNVDYVLDQTRATLGGALTVDGSHDQLPVAVMVEYVYAYTTLRDPQKTDDFVSRFSRHTLSLGAFYSGRKELMLGLTGALAYDRQPGDAIGEERVGRPVSKRTILEGVLRYVW